MKMAEVRIPHNIKEERACALSKVTYVLQDYLSECLGS